ncbi:hypothetical protein DL96DRAFT_1239183 [Flagelloscypha sp. PMI_526]|nr:hypothetical protein DL96DRAFT_1239183 [Flagelloscypha sp. PMI_526]
MGSRSGSPTPAQSAHWARVHNRNAKICQLPREILVDIFGIHRESVLMDADYEDNFAFAGGKPESLGSRPPILWLQPSHVCSIWRDSALACALLWNFVHLNNVEATKVLLLRSVHSPLHVSRRVPLRDLKPSETEVLFDCLKLTLKESYRIETLDLSALVDLTDFESLNSLIAAVPEVELKSIKRLKAHFDGPQHLLDGFSLALAQFLNPLVCDVILSPSSTLTELSLIELSNGWESIDVISLRSLELEGPPERQLSMFEAGLRRLQNLTTLSLNPRLSVADVANNCLEDAIVLPQLQKLKIYGESHVCLYFFSKLSCRPSDLVVGIFQSNDQHGAEVQFVPILKALSPWIDPLPPVRAVVCDISWDHLRIQFTHECAIRMGPGTMDDFFLRHSVLPMVRNNKLLVPQNIHFDLCTNLDTRRTFDFPDLDGVIAQLKPRLVQAETFVLRFDSLDRFNCSLARTLLDLAGTLSKLTTLELGIYRYYVHRDLLFEAMNANSLVDGTPPFPSLQALILRSAEFVTKSPSNKNLDLESPSNLLVLPDEIRGPEIQTGWLISFLTSRRREKKPIKRLVLDDCTGLSADFIDSSVRPLAEEVVIENEMRHWLV